jgi:hypothetical protein
MDCRDVINFLSFRRKNKSYRRIDRLVKRVPHIAQGGGILKFSKRDPQRALQTQFE